MTITVIVLNYNSGGYLTRCLEALGAQNFDNFRVIVADNGSDDGSFSLARQKYDAGGFPAKNRYRFVAIGKNTGFARGNNLMVADVTTPLIALLNPDALPEPGWLSALAAAAQRHCDVAMFGSTQISLADPAKFDGVGDRYFAAGIPWRGGFGHPVDGAPPAGDAFSPCAAAAMYRTDAFRSAGGFDETYFCYVEDVDLGFRLRLAGGHCIQVADAVVHHAGGASSAAGGDGFARFHGMRNMIWTFFKDMPGPLFWPLLPVHLAALCLLALRAVLRGDAKATLAGIGAGLAGLPDIWTARRRIQSGRRASVRDISRAMCWSPWTYLRRAPITGRDLKIP